MKTIVYIFLIFSTTGCFTTSGIFRSGRTIPEKSQVLTGAATSNIIFFAGHLDYNYGLTPRLDIGFSGIISRVNNSISQFFGTSNIMLFGLGPMVHYQPNSDLPMLVGIKSHIYHQGAILISPRLIYGQKSYLAIEPLYLTNTDFDSNIWLPSIIVGTTFSNGIGLEISGFVQSTFIGLNHIAIVYAKEF